MKKLRAYSKSEEAYTDAAFLCGMGLDATVYDERGYGGNLLGLSGESIRIEVPDEQLEEAVRLLATKESERTNKGLEGGVKVAVVPNDSKLVVTLRVFLVSELVLYACIFGYQYWFRVTTPFAVDEYLRTLVLSETLWRLAWHGYWPSLLLSLVSTILCWNFSRIGRSLYLFTTVWSIVATLGPPPTLMVPLEVFLNTLYGTVTSMALALMYWSSLNERFEGGKDDVPTR
jgi:hypothetical protein